MAGPTLELVLLPLKCVQGRPTKWQHSPPGMRLCFLQGVHSDTQAGNVCLHTGQSQGQGASRLAALQVCALSGAARASVGAAPGQEALEQEPWAGCGIHWDGPGKPARAQGSFPSADSVLWPGGGKSVHVLHGPSLGFLEPSGKPQWFPNQLKGSSSQGWTRGLGCLIRGLGCLIRGLGCLIRGSNPLRPQGKSPSLCHLPPLRYPPLAGAGPNQTRLLLLPSCQPLCSSSFTALVVKEPSG